MDYNFEIVPITIVCRGKFDFAYVINIPNHWWNRDEQRVIHPEMLSKKYSIAGAIKVNTVSLTAYFNML